MTKRLLVTLCGRGGSKGVPGKNIRSFLGGPLLTYSLFDALRAFEGACDMEKTVVVDSDASQILAVARSCLPGVFCHRRPPELGGDRVSKVAVLQTLLADVERDQGPFDIVVDLDITSPLRTASDVERVACRLLAGERDLVFSVVKARRNPYFNMVERDGGRVRLCKPSKYVCRQEAPEVFEMNASIYAYRAEALRRPLGHFFELDVDVVEMIDYGVLDIDGEEDFHLMELVYEGLAERQSAYFTEKRCFAGARGGA